MTVDEMIFDAKKKIKFYRGISRREVAAVNAKLAAKSFVGFDIIGINPETDHRKLKRYGRQRLALWLTRLHEWKAGL